MEGIQTLKGSWPWPSIRPYRIPSCITHRPLPMYQISFKLKKLFVDGRTYGRTDISPLYIIRSTLGSRPKYEHSQHWSTAHVMLHPHQRQHKTSNVILSCHNVCHGCLSKLCIIMIMMMININCIIYHCMITIMMTLILLVLFMVAVFLLITITDVIIVIINKDEFNVPLRATAARTCYKM